MDVSQSLSQLMEDGVIDDVLGRIMSGKEAEVFAVTRQGQAVAAKIYKPRHHRSFKNNAGYLEGRANVRDSRSRRAMEKGTTFGREQAEAGWKETEHDALQLAWNAGVRVPQPIFLYEDTLLMQLVVDEEGLPAPRLSDMNLEPEHADRVHTELMESIRKLLRVHRIHGDLSAFNVLMGVDGPTIIDLPQVVDAAGNAQAEEFLVRDVRNVTDYLARASPRLERFAHAGRLLWQHYRRGTLDEVNLEDAAAFHTEAQRRSRRPMEPKQRAAQAGQPRGTDRVVHPDGRVEFVPTPGSNPRRVRFSRDGRGGGGRGQDRSAQDRSAQERGPQERGPQERAAAERNPPQQRGGPADRGERPVRGEGADRGGNGPRGRPGNNNGISTRPGSGAPQQPRQPRQPGGAPPQPRQDARPPQNPRRPDGPPPPRNNDGGPRGGNPGGTPRSGPPRGDRPPRNDGGRRGGGPPGGRR